MSKTLQEQLDYAHEQFDENNSKANEWLDTFNESDNPVEAASVFNSNVADWVEDYLDEADMWLSIINSLTELITQDAIEREADLMDAKALLASEKIKQSLKFSWSPE